MTTELSRASRCPARKFVIASSANVGWTSVRRERHRLGQSVDYDTPLTPERK